MKNNMTRILIAVIAALALCLIGVMIICQGKSRDMEQQKNELIQTAAEKDILKQELAEEREHAEELQAVIDQQDETLIENEEALSLLETGRAAQEGQVSQLQEEKKSLEEGLEKLTGEYEKLTAENKKLTEENRKLTEKNEKLKAENGNLASEKSAAEAALQQYQEEQKSKEATGIHADEVRARNLDAIGATLERQVQAGLRQADENSKVVKT